MATAHPIQLTQCDHATLGVTWSDGHESRYDVRTLRLACHCAACVDEMTGERRFPDSSVPDNIHPLQITSAGQYALHIRWSDGHQSGLVRFDELRAWCGCTICTASVQ